MATGGQLSTHHDLIRLHHLIGLHAQILFAVGVLAAYLAGLPFWLDVDDVDVCGWTVPWWRVMVGMAALLALAQVSAQGAVLRVSHD